MFGSTRVTGPGKLIVHSASAAGPAPVHGIATMESIKILRDGER